MSEDLNSCLQDIIACKLPKEAADRFSKLLDTLSESDDLLTKISTIINAISQDMVNVISARKFCDELVIFINKITDDNLAVSVLQLILTRMQTRNIAFESQLVAFRDVLAKRLETLGNLHEAAIVLSDISLESGQRVYSTNYKLNIYLRIAEYYLKLYEIQDAEAYVNRASLLQPECQDKQLIVRYKIAYAHLLDLKHKFLEAGQRYVELSVRYPWMDDSERLGFLERALGAALLSGAGHQRARLLAILYKDERCQTFEAFPILENMFMGRLINRSLLRNLVPLLVKYYPHLIEAPLAATSPSVSRSQQIESSLTNSTFVQKLIERALIEHNMLAVSLIYNNISLSNLGCLLEISTSEAESTAAHMIGEGRLIGQLDQIDGVIRFENSDSSQSMWSTQIQNLCSAVNKIVEDIESLHPDWVRTHLDSRMSVDTSI